jgi:dTMP kinase
MPSEEGLARKSKYPQDRFEVEEIAFHEQVRQGYLQLTRNEPRRFLWWMRCYPVKIFPVSSGKE